MQRKYIHLYVVLLVLIVFVGFNKSVLSSQKRSEHYVDIPNGFLSFDITKITKIKLIDILNSKKKKYELLNNIDGGFGEIVLTSFFIGKKFEKSEIKRIIYYFKYIDGQQNDIEIEFDKKYYDQCYALLMSELGQPNKKEGVDYCKWQASSKSPNNIQLIRLTKSRSMYFYKGLGLKKDDDAFYLLIRSRDMSLPR